MQWSVIFEPGTLEMVRHDKFTRFLGHNGMSCCTYVTKKSGPIRRLCHFLCAWCNTYTLLSLDKKLLRKCLGKLVEIVTFPSRHPTPPGPQHVYYILSGWQDKILFRNFSPLYTCNTNIIFGWLRTLPAFDQKLSKSFLLACSRSFWFFWAIVTSLL